MFKLEHQGADVAKGKAAEPVIVQLKRSADAKHGDPYAINRALRKELRVSRGSLRPRWVCARAMMISLFVVL